MIARGMHGGAAGLAIGRRRFTRGIAAAGLTGSLTAKAAAATPVLRGTGFALEIGPVPVNITGTPRIAIGVNGMTPAPILRWRQGDTVTIAVTNRLNEPSSLHWHGVRVPSAMDGAPGLSFRGIAPGETFVYRFPIRDSGTYWYHSHSGFQEQVGLYGPIVVEPRAGYRYRFDRDYVVLLSDWTDERPETIAGNLKFQSDYYNRGQRTVGTFIGDVRDRGLAAVVSDRLDWGRMRMSPTDILDVNGSTYTYLMNGHPAAANWTALFRPGESVRLRFINGSAMTLFDVRVPGLAMTVVQADGNDVEPVTVDEFRIGTAETYDVIVRPDTDRAFAIFAQAEDRSGFVSGTLAPRLGMIAPMPPMDPRPMRSMADMGMAPGMDHGSMAQGSMAPGSTAPGLTAPGLTAPGLTAPGLTAGTDASSAIRPGVAIDNVAPMPVSRLNEPGAGLDNNGRRVLTYASLRSAAPAGDPRPPGREIVMHLTGNMQRYIWGFDGKSFSEAEPIDLRLGERVRFVLINDTMMEHPIHLHGLWSELENGRDAHRPIKHTIIVKPGERLSFLVTADEPGLWAFHCHLLYHMDLGMFRVVRVS